MFLERLLTDYEDGFVCKRVAEALTEPNVDSALLGALPEQLAIVLEKGSPSGFSRALGDALRKHRGRRWREDGLRVERAGELRHAARWRVCVGSGESDAVSGIDSHPDSHPESPATIGECESGESGESVLGPPYASTPAGAHGEAKTDSPDSHDSHLSAQPFPAAAAAIESPNGAESVHELQLAEQHGLTGEPLRVRMRDLGWHPVGDGSRWKP